MVGAAVDCYETALDYSLERKQFSKPIAGYQLTQAKFAEMLTQITMAQLTVYQLGRLKDQGKMRFDQVSLAKRNHCSMARDVARTCREILGGNGIIEDYSPIRHMANIETVFTYEGTHEMHTLILGQAITGMAAFD
jgi:alkylation response protein AidB-like acyl-CoA dehydrogenase